MNILKDIFPILSRSNNLNANWLTASGAQRRDSNERNSTKEINLRREGGREGDIKHAK